MLKTEYFGLNGTAEAGEKLIVQGNVYSDIYGQAQFGHACSRQVKKLNIPDKSTCCNSKSCFKGVDYPVNF